MLDALKPSNEGLTVTERAIPVRGSATILVRTYLPDGPGPFPLVVL